MYNINNARIHNVKYSVERLQISLNQTRWFPGIDKVLFLITIDRLINNWEIV